MAPIDFSTRLIEKIPRAGDVTSFRFEKPNQLEYEPGQWTSVDFDLEGETFGHHFTLSSAPTEPFLEFTTHVRQSDFKQALDRLEMGHELRMKAPYGQFVLRPETGEVVFLTGGIGITPVRSILRTMADGSSDRRIVLFYGNRNAESTVFLEELRSLDDQLPYLRMVLVFSEPDENWRGARGHIDGELLERELRTMAGWSWYLSGPPSMVNDLRSMLEERGIADDSIVTEEFQGYE